MRAKWSKVKCEPLTGERARTGNPSHHSLALRPLGHRGGVYREMVTNMWQDPVSLDSFFKITNSIESIILQIKHLLHFLIFYTMV